MHLSWSCCTTPFVSNWKQDLKTSAEKLRKRRISSRHSSPTRKPWIICRNLRKTRNMRFRSFGQLGGNFRSSGSSSLPNSLRRWIFWKFVAHLRATRKSWAVWIRLSLEQTGTGLLKDFVVIFLSWKEDLSVTRMEFHGIFPSGAKNLVVDTSSSLGVWFIRIGPKILHLHQLTIVSGISPHYGQCQICVQLLCLKAKPPFVQVNTFFAWCSSVDASNFMFWPLNHPFLSLKHVFNGRNSFFLKIPGQIVRSPCTPNVVSRSCGRWWWWRQSWKGQNGITSWPGHLEA